MKALIQISRDLMVDARELHAMLKVTQSFRDWITRRIADFGLIEDQDYRTRKSEIPRVGPGRPTKEYSLTLDMAKELCMVEKTKPAKEIRCSFLAAEEEHGVKSGSVRSRLDALQVWLDTVREHERRRLQGHDADIISITPS